MAVEPNFLIDVVVPVIEVVNIVLLLALLYIYTGSYKRIRSQYTLGMMVFVGLFLFRYLLSVVSLLTAAQPAGGRADLEPPIALLTAIVECIGFAIVLRLSLD